MLNYRVAGSIFAVAAAAMALVAQDASGQQNSAPPPLDITLAPQATGTTADRIDVTMRIPAPKVDAGKPLLRMPVVLVGTPTAAYTAGAILANDDKGPLALTQADEDPGPSGTYRNYLVTRATVGDVTVRYGAPPRQVSAATRNGPLFDLRAEAGGLQGAGVYFFAIPAGTGPYSIHLAWDLKKMPDGARGISSRGEGNTSWIATADTLEYQYYATGPVKSSPSDGKGDFVFYWLSTPPFDPVELGSRTKRLYQYMSNFFGDEHASYSVFSRANPYPSGGGTALARSFMFGYGVNGQTIASGTDMLIAHEMAHTWPTIGGGEHAVTAWYTEGTAEYYSTLLSLRAGTIDLKRFLSLINDKASDYYTGPYLKLTNEEAGKKFWSDARAQRVPYGRGFMYFVKVNAQIRAKSGGKRSVDDLVLDVLRRQRAGEEVGVKDWRNMVVAELGESAGREYDDMTAGGVIVPPPSAFGPCFKPEKAKAFPFDLGFDEMRLGVVKDLRPGSPAALAGAQEGDTIASMTPLTEARVHPDAEMQLTVQRGGKTIVLHFKPQGAAVEGWRWVRVPGVPDTSCRL